MCSPPIAIDFVLVAVILISSRTTMNPDNLATPLAASIGDVVSISLLAAMATLLFEHIGNGPQRVTVSINQST